MYFTLILPWAGWLERLLVSVSWLGIHEAHCATFASDCYCPFSILALEDSPVISTFTVPFSHGEYYGHLSAERKQEIDNLRSMALLKYLAKFTLVGDRFQAAGIHLNLSFFSRLAFSCTYFINIRL
jgi:hypothetical protein